jgi:hypothetical protein
MHSSPFPFRKVLLGSFQGDIGDLLDKCEDGQGECDPTPFHLRLLIDIRN